MKIVYAYLQAYFGGKDLFLSGNTPLAHMVGIQYGWSVVTDFAFSRL